MKINSFGTLIPEFSALSRQHLKKWLSTLQFLACDVDGCLIPAVGLETANNKGTVDNYLKRNTFAATMLRDISTILVQDGLRIGLCTGRSSTFAKAIVEKMFTPGTCGYMVAEGGAVKSFFNPVSGQWVDEVPQYINPQHIANFNTHKETIIEVGEKQLRGFLELGKSCITSFNPPKGMTTDEFAKLFEQELITLGIRDLVNFEFSSSAVDIGPLGVNKVACLLEIVGSANTAVLVDAKNDEGVTKEFLVNLMPSNAKKDIQDIAVQSMLSLQSDFESLYGTINLFMKIKELRG